MIKGQYARPLTVAAGLLLFGGLLLPFFSLKQLFVFTTHRSVGSVVLNMIDEGHYLAGVIVAVLILVEPFAVILNLSMLTFVDHEKYPLQLLKSAKRKKWHMVGNFFATAILYFGLSLHDSVTVKWVPPALMDWTGFGAVPRAGFYSFLLALPATFLATSAAANRQAELWSEALRGRTKEIS